jgi:hypothetical protein
MTVSMGDQVVAGSIPKTSDWDKFQAFNFGFIDLKQPGEQQIKVRCQSEQTWKAINLRFLKLTPQP